MGGSEVRAMVMGGDYIRLQRLGGKRQAAAQQKMENKMLG